MEFERYRVTFERTFEIDVLVRPGTGLDKIKQICDDMTFSNHTMDEWAGISEWEAFVGQPEPVSEDDADLRYNLVRGRYREAAYDSVLTEEDVFVLDDKGEGFVAPEDAAWCWAGDDAGDAVTGDLPANEGVATDEQARELEAE